MPTHLLIQGSGYSRSGGIYDWNGILPTDKLFQSDEDSLITSLSPWQQSNQVYSDFLSELTGIKSSLLPGGLFPPGLATWNTLQNFSVLHISAIMPDQ